MGSAGCSASTRSATTRPPCSSGAGCGARCRPGRSPRPTPCSSTSSTTACVASRTGSCGVPSTSWRPWRPASRTSSCSARSSSSNEGATVDLILLDAPAAGHAITFLESARGLLDAVTVGPINTQARDVLEMLTDPGTLLGGARHAAGGDTGERARRHRVLAGGSCRLQPRARDRERSLPRARRDGRRPGRRRRSGRSRADARRGGCAAHRGRFRSARVDACRTSSWRGCPSVCRSRRSTCRSSSRPTSHTTTCTCSPTRCSRASRTRLAAVMTLEAIVAASSIVLCCGTGGVGKTTIAASIALHGARRGRRCVVVTIDPAKRLADALGSRRAHEHAVRDRRRLAG